MKKRLIIIASLLLVILTGCKSIVKDYSTAELDALNLSLVGVGKMRGGKFTDSEFYWNCPGGNPKITINVAGRTAKTKIELHGRFYRGEAEVSDIGTVLVSSDLFQYKLNLKADLKRQEAKISVSNGSIHEGCQSEWFNINPQ